MYFGSQRVHHSADRGRTWTTLSQDLTTNDPEKLKQATSGGLTIDATKAENHCTILCIAPSPSRPNELWVGTDDGRVQHTADRGETWTDHSSQLKGLPAGSWIPFIHVSPHSPDEVYVVANNHRRNDWAPYLYRTMDGGKSWKRLVYGEDVPAHVQCVVQDVEAPDLLFLGTEEGLYFSVDRGVNWSRWTHDVPAVPVRDLALQEREGDLVLGTFGRAAYVIEDLSPLRALANEGAAVLNATFLAFDAATGYDVPWPRPAGSRFMADHVWEGENRPRSAHGHVYVHPDTAEVHSTLSVAIVDPTTGDTFAAWSETWSQVGNNCNGEATRMGFVGPAGNSTTTTSQEGAVPWRPQVNTTPSLTFGTHVDTMQLTWSADPRTTFDWAAYAAGKAHRKLVDAEVERLAGLMQELAVAEEAMKAMASVWSLLDSTEDVDSLQTEMSEGIKDIREMLWTPKDFVGYDHVTVRVMDELYEAMPDLHEGATATDERQLERAIEAINRVQSRSTH